MGLSELLVRRIEPGSGEDEVAQPQVGPGDEHGDVVTTMPYRVKVPKEMGWPSRAAIPVTTTLALAPIAVALPPRPAPRANAHHSDIA